MLVLLSHWARIQDVFPRQFSLRLINIPLPLLRKKYCNAIFGSNYQSVSASHLLMIQCPWPFLILCYLSTHIWKYAFIELISSEEIQSFMKSNQKVAGELSEGKKKIELVNPAATGTFNLLCKACYTVHLAGEKLAGESINITLPTQIRADQLNISSYFFLKYD